MVIAKIGANRGAAPVSSERIDSETIRTEPDEGVREATTLSHTVPLTPATPIAAASIPSTEAIIARTIANAVGPLRGLSPAERDTIESVLRDELTTDPMLLELLARVTTPTE
jgi:hypothetical protein